MSWLFGNEYRISTSTTAYPLFTGDQLASPWGHLPLEAMTHDASIVDVFKKELATGIGNRIERAFKYAKRYEEFPLIDGYDSNKGYDRGLVKHTALGTSVGFAETKTHLENLHQMQVSLDYYHVCPLNLEHVGHAYLNEVQGYSTLTNISTVQSGYHGHPVYLEHMGLELAVDVGVSVPDASELPEWQVPPNQLYTYWDNPFAETQSWVVSTTGNTEIVLRFAYLGSTPKAGSPTATRWALNGIPANALVPDTTVADFEKNGYHWGVTYGQTDADIEDFIYRYTVRVGAESLGFDQDKEYFHAKYYTNLTGTKVVNYFTHATDAGSIPELESTTSLSEDIGEFFPVVFFRENFRTLADESLADTRAYIQSANFCRRLKIDYQLYGDSLLGEMPEDQLAGISQAFIKFGIPVTSETDVGKRYLFEFFYWLALSNPDPAGKGYYSEGVWYNDDLEERKVIVFTESSMVQRLEYTGISTRLVAGNIGQSNTAINQCDSVLLQHTQRYLSRELQDRHADTSVWQTIERTRNIPVWRYRKQVTATHYREVLVASPQMSYLLTDSAGGNAQNAYVTESEHVIVPLSYPLVKKHFKALKKQRLYLESVHVQMNSYDRTKLEWYQTERFRLIMLAVSVVIIVASAGTMTAQVYGTYTTILAAVGGVTAAAVVLTALVYIGAQYGIDKIFEYTAKKLGSDNAEIATALLAVYAAYSAAKGDPSATKWATASTSMLKASNAEWQGEAQARADELKKILEEDEELREFQQELTDESNRKNLLMEVSGLIPSGNAFEKPEDFYTRTLSGTKGPEVTLNQPALYYKTALRLPDAFDTVGDS